MRFGPVELFLSLVLRIRPTIWLYTSRQRTCYTVVVPFMSCQARLRGNVADADLAEWPTPLSGFKNTTRKQRSSFPGTVYRAVDLLQHTANVVKAHKNRSVAE